MALQNSGNKKFRAKASSFDKKPQGVFFCPLFSAEEKTAWLDDQIFIEQQLWLAEACFIWFVLCQLRETCKRNDPSFVYR